MRLVTFRHKDIEQVGALSDGADLLQPVDAVDMTRLIEESDRGRPRLNPVGDPIHVGEVELLAPIPRPRRNIFCVGKNYRDHAREFAKSGYEAGAVRGAEIDDFPAVFSKPASCVIGSGSPVDLHRYATDSVNYEGELAIVIGRRGKDIPAAAAMDYVWAYTIINDVTARDRQRRHKQWFLGKALDTFCPMGPWLTTADAVDATDLRVRTWVNGELRQDASTKDLIFDIPSLIETISAGLTLHPGDIVATGTPAGVGIGFDPPRFLKSGDNVVVEIDGLGRLENSFRDERS